jgi:TonB family protein
LFPLTLGSRPSAFAQQPPSQGEKERGVELYRKGNHSEAAKVLQAVVKKQAADADAWYFLGLSLHRTGKIKDARKAFEKTLSLRPDFAPAYTAVAYMRLLSNDNKEALKYAEKALALDPKNYEALYIVGSTRLRANAPAEALAKAEEALKIRPDYPSALLLKTNALVSLFAEEGLKQINEPGQPGVIQSSDTADAEAKRRSKYQLLKTASESLEAYLKLRPEPTAQEVWLEQLEALRVYARLASDPKADESVAPMTATLRPTILYREKARYTDQARNAWVQGTVVLMAVFAEDGGLKNIMAIKSLSHGLTEQAILAARKIRFSPALRDGKPVSVVGTLEFTFNLY